MYWFVLNSNVCIESSIHTQYILGMYRRRLRRRRCRCTVRCTRLVCRRLWLFGSILKRFRSAGRLTAGRRERPLHNPCLALPVRSALSPVGAGGSAGGLHRRAAALGHGAAPVRRGAPPGRAHGELGGGHVRRAAAGRAGAGPGDCGGAPQARGGARGRGVPQHGLRPRDGARGALRLQRGPDAGRVPRLPSGRRAGRTWSGWTGSWSTSWRSRRRANTMSDRFELMRVRARVRARAAVCVGPYVRYLFESTRRASRCVSEAIYLPV